jgi:hypothetical protein
MKRVSLAPHEIYAAAAETFFDNENDNWTTCNALIYICHKSVEYVPRGSYEIIKHLSDVFKPEGAGPWYFENAEMDFSREREHRILSLLLMSEILKSGGL